MGKSGGKVVIKKYANRRLYDTESSSYITLDRLAEMVREGREFEVVDAKTGEDITRQVLTQIIVDEEARGSTMLPVNFLKQLIGLYGNSMQGVVPQYLDAAMDAFKRNQQALGRHSAAIPSPTSPSATWRCSRMRAELFGSGAKAGGAASETELEELRAELAKLQEKVDRLSK